MLPNNFVFKLTVSFFQVLLLFFYCSNSSKENLSLLPGLNEKYLAMNEKFLRDYYGSDDKKEIALNTLKERCNKRELRDYHSCYNLSVLYFQSKDYQKAYDYAYSAVKKNPSDSLYQNMLRQAAIKTEQVYSLSILKIKNREIVSLYNQMIFNCKKGKTERVLQDLKALISKKYISQNMLDKGILTTCLKEETRTSLSKNLSENKLNYVHFYQNEKAKSNYFAEIWDTSYFPKKSSIENMEFLDNELTISWRNFKRYVLKNNRKFAVYHFKIFLNQLREKAQNDNQNKHLYKTLELASKIIIEQDRVYSDFRFLLKEY